MLAAEDGFAYDMVYVEPALIADALGRRRSVPFVTDAIGSDPELHKVLRHAFEGFPEPLSPLALAEVIAVLADALSRRSDNRRHSRELRWSTRALDIARAMLGPPMLLLNGGRPHMNQKPSALGIPFLRFSLPRSCSSCTPFEELAVCHQLEADLAFVKYAEPNGVVRLIDFIPGWVAKRLI